MLNPPSNSEKALSDILDITAGVWSLKLLIPIVEIPTTLLESTTKFTLGIVVEVVTIFVAATPITSFTFPDAPKPPVFELSKINLSPDL